MGYKKKWYDNEAWLRSMYIDKEYRISEIAVYAGVTPETIRRLLIRYGIKGER